MQYFNLGGGNSIRLATGTPAPTVDPDAQAFITAAAITNPTQQSAVNQLVVDLKGYGVWSKMKALYPFLGGTASQHKFNLKNPLDTDAAFRLVFNGGWTHSSTGALPNGTNAWANSFYNPSILGQLNSAHLSYYSRTNNSIDSQIEIGAYPQSYFLCYRFFATEAYCGINSIDNPPITPISPSARFLIGSRISSTTGKFYVNGNLHATDNKTSISRPNQNVYIGALNNNGTAAFQTNKQVAFASIGDGLTDTEASNLYTRVQAYQTALSRQV